MRKTIDIRKRTTVLVFVGLLLGICSPAWSADSGSTVAGASGSAVATVSNPHGNSLLGMLSAALSDTTTRPRERYEQCQASIYSQHDVVGDPETCIMNRVTFGGGATATGIP
jgi:hypothetical protein